jgi:hypothetical protein
MFVYLGPSERGGAGIRPDATPARSQPTVTSPAVFGSGRRFGGTLADKLIRGIESISTRVRSPRALLV